jgi:two-component system chemotaxis response regulator CheB
MRRALSRRIASDPRFVVIDTAENGREGVDKAFRLVPDVVTLDVEMPVMDGIAALKEIVARSDIPVVMLSAVTSAGAKITMEALEIGAVDFIPKANGAERVHETLLAAVMANTRQKVRAQRAATPLQPQVVTRVAAAPKIAVKPKIVLIGSSTGGPQALTEVIKQLPASLPVPVVVAQHMPAQFTLALAKRLNDMCPIRVVEAKDGDSLDPGVVYVAPGGSQLRVTAKRLQVSPNKGESLYQPSVDVLAESVLAAFGKNVLGVMLTGMGSDGAREFTKLRAAGAHNIAQDQASCIVYGMPKSLVDAGGATEVLPLGTIGDRIRTICCC